MIFREKQILRARMKGVLAGFSERPAASARLRSALFSCPAWRSARVVYGFWPLASEPDWLGSGGIPDKVLAFPVTDGVDLRFVTGGTMEPGVHGVREPRGGRVAEPADLVLVPGLAFDRSGFRLGRGRGFYDRWLGGQTGVRTLGLAFSCQVVETLPCEPHDLRVEAVLTEDGLLGGGG